MAGSVEKQEVYPHIKSVSLKIFARATDAIMLQTRSKTQKLILLLSPNLHGFVIAKRTRSNHILSGVTWNWYYSVGMTFQFLNYFPGLQLPQV